MLRNSQPQSATNSTQTQSNKSDALRRIMCVEGMGKMIRSNFNLTNNQEPDTLKWDYLMEQVLDPSKYRPKRAAEAGNSQIATAFNPATGQAVDPALIRENYDTSIQHEWTVFTSVTTLPKDGNIELFGGYGIGVVLNMRLCDLNKERFVFDKEAMTMNDWWLRDDAQSQNLQRDMKGMTINAMREKEKLAETAAKRREYNEQLVGLNAKSICGIVIHPNPKTEPGNNEYYAERFTAIDRKIYASVLLGVVLPIIILGPKDGVVDYSIQEQNQDIRQYLAANPQSPKAALLKNMLEFNQLNPVVEEQLVGQNAIKRNVDNTKYKPAPSLARFTEFLPMLANGVDLLRRRNDKLRELMAMDYMADLLGSAVDQGFDAKLVATNAEYVACLSAVETFEKDFLSRFSQDTHALQYSQKICCYEKCKYAELADYQKARKPKVAQIMKKLDLRTAVNEDIAQLNEIDLDHADGQCKALEKIAELKIQFIKNRIIAIGNKNSGQGISASLRKIVDLIVETRKSNFVARWRECLEAIVVVATKQQNGVRSWMSHHQNAERACQEQDELCKFIVDVLAVKPKGLFKGYTVPVLSCSSK